MGPDSDINNVEGALKSVGLVAVSMGLGAEGGQGVGSGNAPILLLFELMGLDAMGNGR